MLTAAPPYELERAVGGWHVEWLALPLVFQTAGASVEAMEMCLDSLEVDAEVMRSFHADSDPSGAGSPQIDSVLSAYDQTLAHPASEP